MRVCYNQPTLMGRKGWLSDPHLRRNTAIMEGMVVPWLQRSIEEAGRWGEEEVEGGWRTSYKAAIIRVIHTLRSKKRPLSGWLGSWGLIRTSISTEISCKWRRGSCVRRGARQTVLRERSAPTSLIESPLHGTSAWTKHGQRQVGKLP